MPDLYSVGGCVPGWITDRTEGTYYCHGQHWVLVCVEVTGLVETALKIHEASYKTGSRTRLNRPVLQEQNVG